MLRMMHVESAEELSIVIAATGLAENLWTLRTLATGGLQAHTGNVGEIQIYDKQLNGFKVKYDGSAESATLILRIKGGK